MKVASAIVLIFFLSSVGLAQPISKLAGLPGASLRMGFGAYGIGFGNALTAVRSDRIVGYYNPALAAFQSKPVIQVSVGFLTLDRYLNHVAYTAKLPPSAGLSLAIINSGTSDIEGRDRDGQITSSFSTSENVFLFSFGLQVSPFLSIGISPKILYHKVYEGISSTTVGFDFGLLYLISDEWTIGMCLQDVGSKYRWDTSPLYGLSGNTTTELFPVRKKAGVSFQPQEIPVLAAIEIEQTGVVWFMRGGIDYAMADQFRLHGGVDQLGRAGGIPPKPAFGFTTKTEVGNLITKLTYSYVVEPYSPSGIHLLALAVEFQ